jgi:hypothetical protein
MLDPLLDLLVLAGALPVEYASLSKLHSLWVFSNKLTGQLPAAYSAMTALRDLQVSYNKFTGERKLRISCMQRQSALIHCTWRQCHCSSTNSCVLTDAAAVLLLTLVSCH